MNPGDLDTFQKRGGVLPGYPPNVRRLFAPDDDVHGALVAAVKSAKVSLACAMYGWDDDELDELFREAWQAENLPVRLALDKSQAAGVHERQILAKWPTDVIGNEIVIGQSRLHAISHLKLLVVDGVLTVGGSTNWSLSGEQKQNNEAIFLFDAVYAAETRAKIDLCFSEMQHQAA
jgi:phosphatidylserine/phosphatidylglycerophosphate/cardiolipin synthase-like enzyme